MTSIADRKAELRTSALVRRRSFDPAAGEALAANVLRAAVVPPGAVVAGVWPLPNEMDLRPLLHALHGLGHTVVLPETPPRGSPLVFRVWAPGCTMLPERFGTQRPDGPVAVPDLVFVPLLAFDSRGYRLGYGGGYYDRTLQALPHAEAIGFGYMAQLVEDLPVEPHDVPLNRIATEAGLVQTNVSGQVPDPGTRFKN